MSVNYNYEFDRGMMEALIGGSPVLDVKRLNIQNLNQADSFVKAYGYDLSSESDLNSLWAYHRRAVTLIRSELLREGEQIPESVTSPNALKDLRYLLIYASTYDQRENSMQMWACAILRVMHVLVHLENDLFTGYSREIQDQILRPFQDHIYSDPVSGTHLGDPTKGERIRLKKFDIKPFKTADSSVIKLLAKPDQVAFTLLDKVGVRFVTKHLFDVFRVLRYLIDQSLVSFPHLIPDQSNNTLYPLNFFFDAMEGFTRDMKMKAGEIDQILKKKLEGANERAEFRKKLNTFSSSDYQFVKFISRQRVRVQIPAKKGLRELNFFYPFEVQIVHYEAFLKNLSGPSSHEEYKARQIIRARLRVLGR